MTKDLQQRVTIPEHLNNIRADKALAGCLEGGISRVHIQDTFKLNQVFVNGQPISKSYRVKTGEEIEITLPALPATEVKAVEMPLDIVFEDDDIVVVNKAPGQVVHPGNGTGEDTLVHALLHHTGGNLSTAGGTLRPGVVHRLDKETSGLIVFAKSDAAYQALVHAFSERDVEKEYVAIVSGKPRLLSGSVNQPIGRHETVRVKMTIHPHGREAQTDWEVIETWPQHAFLRLYLHTGRTHQIRVHLSHIGHPIVGDRTYGYRPRPEFPAAPRVLLHAEHLAFNHPITGKPLAFKASIPQDIEDYIAALHKREAV